MSALVSTSMLENLSQCHRIYDVREENLANIMVAVLKASLKLKLRIRTLSAVELFGKRSRKLR